MSDIIKYPLDLTGLSSKNLIVGERHTLGVGKNRTVILEGGPFFSESVEIFDLDRNIFINPNEDFVVAQLHETATLMTGKSVCSVIIIKNEEVSANIEVKYQVLGGGYHNYRDAIVQMVDQLSLDERPVTWEMVLGKPSAYLPTAHLHDVGDIYGFEYIVDSLETIRQAILMGDQYTIDEIRDLLRDLADLLTDHKNDKNNPHQVTKAQVGLGLVENYPIASQAEAIDGVTNKKYMTPLRVGDVINNLVQTIIEPHINDKNNPHQVTKAQVGLGLVENYPIASQAEAIDGTVMNRFMTPLRVKEAIDKFAGDLLTEHINDKNNPHQVTKAQVGLGLVENYPIATQEEAKQGTRNDRYITPLLLKNSFDTMYDNKVAGGMVLVDPIIVAKTDAGAPYYTSWMTTRYSVPVTKYGSGSTRIMRAAVPLKAYNGSPTGVSNTKHYQSRRVWFRVQGVIWASYSKDGDTSNVYLRVRRRDTGTYLKTIVYLQSNKANSRTSNGVTMYRSAYTNFQAEGNVSWAGDFYFDYDGSYDIDIELHMQMYEYRGLQNWWMTVETYNRGTPPGPSPALPPHQ